MIDLSLRDLQIIGQALGSFHDQIVRDPANTFMESPPTPPEVMHLLMTINQTMDRHYEENPE